MPINFNSFILTLFVLLIHTQAISAIDVSSKDSVILKSSDPFKIQKKWKSRFYRNGGNVELKNYGFGLGGYTGEFLSKFADRSWSLNANAAISNFGSLYSTKYLNYNPMFGADNLDPRSNIIGTRGETNLILPGKISQNDSYDIKFKFSPASMISIQLQQSGNWITDSIHYDLDRFSYKENKMSYQNDHVRGERIMYNRKSKVNIAFGRFSNKPNLIYSFAIDHDREVSRYDMNSNTELSSIETSQSTSNNRISTISNKYIHELKIPKIRLNPKNPKRFKLKFDPFIATSVKYTKTKESLNWRMDQQHDQGQELIYQSDITQVGDRNYKTFEASLKFTNWLKKTSKLKLELITGYNSKSAELIRAGSQSSLTLVCPEVELTEIGSSRLNESSAKVKFSYKKWQLKVAPTAVWQNSDKVGLSESSSNSGTINYFLPIKFESPTARKVRFVYRSEILSPTFYQLLPYQDRINPTYVFNGNPELDYGFSHKVTLNKYFPRALRLFKKNAKKARAFMNTEVSVLRQLNPIVISVNYDSLGVVNVNYTNVKYTDRLSATWKWTQRIGKKMKLTLKPQYSITNYGYEINEAYQTAWNNTLDVAFDARLKLKTMQINIMADYFNVSQEYNQDLGMAGSFEMLGIGAMVKGNVDELFTYSVFGGYNQLLNSKSESNNQVSVLANDHYFKLDLTAKLWLKNRKVAFGLICRDLLGQNKILRSFTTANTIERIQGNSQGRAILFTVSVAMQPKQAFHGF
jgi:hypothetical protein